MLHIWQEAMDTPGTLVHEIVPWTFSKYSMDNLHYRLNFDPDKTNKIFCYSTKKHVEIS